MRHYLRLLLYCYDKTLTKNNSGRKGFISASSYDLSWREAGTGTPGNTLSSQSCSFLLLGKLCRLRVPGHSREVGKAAI